MTIDFARAAPSMSEALAAMSRATGLAVIAHCDHLAQADVDIDQTTLWLSAGRYPIGDVMAAIIDAGERGWDSIGFSVSANWIELSSQEHLDRRDRTLQVYDTRALVLLVEQSPWAEMESLCVSCCFPTLRRPGKKDSWPRPGDQVLVDLIVESISPDDWDVVGGSVASIREFSGMILIDAPPRFHSGVEELLDCLDRRLSMPICR